MPKVRSVPVRARSSKKAVKAMHVLLIPSCKIGPGLNELNPGDTLVRLTRGLELWREGKFDRILVVGGRFNAPTVQTIAASELMIPWLTKRGVPREAIVFENQSRDTYENVSFGLKALKKAGLESASITVVTQWQHAVRFWLTFFFGYGRLVHLVPMDYPVPWSVFLSEWFFMVLHLIFPRGNLSPISRWHRARLSKLAQTSP
jgi:hypothetical protein